MSSDPKDDNGITRRDFASRLGLAAAGVAVGADIFGTRVGAAPLSATASSAPTTGSSSPSIGIHSQGNSLKKGFARLKNVEIKTLCDVDENLFASRANDKSVTDAVPTFKPGYQQDLRRVFEDKDIDAVVIAIPNHWHALASIWGAQAGKHVYIEKPASHTMWEGRQMINAARAYNRVMQVGTMNRSRPAVHRRDQVHAGRRHRQDLHGARPVLQAAAQHRQVPRRSDGCRPIRRLRFTTVAKGNDGPYTAEYLAKVDYNLWMGPAPAKPFNRNRFHYNWHWQWDYGNGDTGNQGPHQFDIARWGMGKKRAPGEGELDGRLLRRPAVGAGNARHADGDVRVRRRHDHGVRHARRAHAG